MSNDSDFDAVFDALGPPPPATAPPRESSLSSRSLTYLDTWDNASLLESVGIRGVYDAVESATSASFRLAAARSPSTNEAALQPPGLNTTREGTDVIYFPSGHLLCLGYIGTLKTKLCTRMTCDVSSHQTSQPKSFRAGLYIKAGANAVYATPMLPADKIPV
eukprot:9985534-Ditylum_brightwellii.AAC.1